MQHVQHARYRLLLQLLSWEELRSPWLWLLTKGHRRVDFDSPKERQKLMLSIAHSSLEQIDRDYHPDLLLDYALLDRLFLVNNPDERAVAYGQFENLVSSKRLRSWLNGVTGEALTTHKKLPLP